MSVPTDWSYRFSGWRNGRGEGQRVPRPGKGVEGQTLLPYPMLSLELGSPTCISLVLHLLKCKSRSRQTSWGHCKSTVGMGTFAPLPHEDLWLPGHFSTLEP